MKKLLEYVDKRLKQYKLPIIFAVAIVILLASFITGKGLIENVVVINVTSGPYQQN